MSTANEGTNKNEAALGYQATDSDLPRELWPAEQRRQLPDAKAEVLRIAGELGMSLTETQIDRCTIILYVHWQDAEPQVLR